MLKEKTRRSLRAVLASACALSLAASMAFPLAAIAQSGSTAEADQLVAVDTSAEASAEVETPVVSEPASQPTGEDATAPAPTTSEPASDTSTGMDTATESTSGKADDTEAPDDTNADPDADAATTPDPDATPDPDVDDSADSDTKAAADTAPTQAKVDLIVTCPAEHYLTKGVEKEVSDIVLPSGMTFAEFRQQAQQNNSPFDKQTSDFFFNLGTDNDIAVGTAHPLLPGFVFTGWFDLSSHKIVSADDPIIALPMGAGNSLTARVLYATWAKNGSNVTSFNPQITTLNGAANISVEGVLAGSNISAGVPLVVETESIEDEASRTAYHDEFDAAAVLGIYAGAAPAGSHFDVQKINLFADGTQIHDGFGSLTINFRILHADNEELLIRIWHKHENGSITYEDVEPVNMIASTTVTDLSVFALGIMHVSKDPSDGDGDGDSDSDGNQDGTKPPADGGGDNQGNTNSPAGDNSNGQGDNSGKNDNGNGSGTQGTNNSKNSGYRHKSV